MAGVDQRCKAAPDRTKPPWSVDGIETSNSTDDMGLFPEVSSNPLNQTGVLRYISSPYPDE